MKGAAMKFFRKLLTRCEHVPRVIITDKLDIYGAAQRARLPSVEHRQSQYLNNRAENRLGRIILYVGVPPEWQETRR